MRLAKADWPRVGLSRHDPRADISSHHLKKQHAKAISEGDTEFSGGNQADQTLRLPRRFELYTLRHTCLTRWAPHMDPWTLAYLAGHRDMNITKRYVHPQEQTIRRRWKEARGKGWAYFWAYC